MRKIIIFLIFLLINIKLFNICITNNDKYDREYYLKTERIISLKDSQRGRILDRNGKVLVDNKEINMLVYNKLENSKSDEEVIANSLSNILNMNKDKILNKLNSGYSYESKVIKEKLSDIEVAKINELSLKGVNIVTSYERVYPYGDVLKSVFGLVKVLPKELKDYYLEKGYSLDSIVGVSGLEMYYDSYLRGEDSKYKLNYNNKLIKIKNAKKGNDLVLSIDIDKELLLYDILKEEMQNAKKSLNTDFYNHSYVIVGNPKTGNIEAMLALLYYDGKFVDITNSIVSSSYTVGSVVKGASISVGYKNNLININERVLDSCIKISNVPKKCSWKSLGVLNDIKALALSSNYYQFVIAQRLANSSFKYNGKLNSNIEHFNVYRDTFKEYGLGNYTYIDLPYESSGIKGKKISDDLLLNLSIGQYDSYTPIELFQYINTIANDGNRLKPSLKLDRNNVFLNKVNLDDIYIKRIKEGLREVMVSGTGKNYVDKSVLAAGKTGTSETFVDSNNDNIMDTKTITSSFVMYAPYNNPRYSLVIISPNIAKVNGDKSFKYNINSNLSRKISEKLLKND